MPKTLQDLTFTRGTGATRFNEYGNLVGVDFSTTSLTIGTGPQTFTLLATGDRDWSPGQGVIAVAQAGATGSMTGTVTSYNTTTQVLVINVASVTGSGTGTDWRIGSLDLRRTFDPVTGRALGFVSESQRTNRVTNNTFRGAVTGTPGTLPTNMAVTLAGVTRSVVAVGMINGINYIDIRISGTPNSTAAQTITFDAVTAAIGETWSTSGWFALVAGSFANISANQFQLRPGNEANATQFLPTATLTRVVNTRTMTATAAAWTLRYNFNDTVTPVDFTIRIGLPQTELGASATSPIPTSSIAITRASDLAALSGTGFAAAFNSTAGTLIIEATTPTTAGQSVVASLNGGSAANTLRIAQRNSGTAGSIRKMMSDGAIDVAAVNLAAANTLRSDGLDPTEVDTGSGQVMLGVAALSTNVFVVVGANGSIRKSTDGGLTYSARTSGTTAQLNGVASSGTTVVAGGAGGVIVYSTDSGATWTTATSGTTNNINDISVVGGVFYAPHTAGVQRSGDGATWTSRTIGGTSFTVNRVAGASPTVVAVGSLGRYSISTDDGLTWANSALTGATTQALQGLSLFGGLYVAAGNAGVIITSANGTTWTLRATGVTSALFTVMYSVRDLTWYSAGDNGTIIRSADGLAWQSAANDATVSVTSSSAITSVQIPGKWTPGGRNRIAISWATGVGIKASINGAAAVTNAAAVMPSVTQLTVGGNVVGSIALNGAIKLTRVYRTASGDAELQALSRI